jgi:hypothetical protein
MQNEPVTYADILRNALAQRLTMAKALAMLRCSGATPNDAIDAGTQVTGKSRDDARQMVSASRAWSGPRPGVALGAHIEDWPGATGQHGRSGHGAASVLPHLARQAQSRAGATQAPRR